MDWKGNLQKSVIWGIFFSAAVQIIAERGHVNIMKFIVLHCYLRCCISSGSH